MSTLNVNTFNVVNCVQAIPSTQFDVSTESVEQNNQSNDSLSEISVGTMNVPEEEMCPTCFSVYSTNEDWSEWILQDDVHYCSQLCADHVHCSECTTMLGRQPWVYRLSAWGNNCLCSYDCWLRYCKRMEEEYPMSDEEIVVDIDAI